MCDETCEPAYVLGVHVLASKLFFYADLASLCFERVSVIVFQATILYIELLYENDD